MSYFTHSVVNVWCGECLVDMLCDECLWCLKMFEADFFHLDLSMVLKYIYCVMLIARTVRIATLLYYQYQWCGQH